MAIKEAALYSNCNTVQFLLTLQSCQSINGACLQTGNPGSSHASWGRWGRPGIASDVFRCHCAQDSPGNSAEEGH